MNYTIPILISFVVSVLLSPFAISFLRKLKFSQTERAELETHLKKQGTPTMGGVVILAGVIVACLWSGLIEKNNEIWPILFMTVGFGIVGFLDDFLKVVLKREDGLKPKQKMFLQFLITAVFIYFYVFIANEGMDMILPFSGGKSIDIGYFAIPMMFIVILGTVNAVNFTDGLDGLASSVTILVSVFLAVAALILRPGIYPVIGAVIGALMGFLLFNVHPAKVFMGDTGSLALGGFVVSVAYMLDIPLFILMIGLVYFCEILSVMIQVSYFKMTHGKRVFRMTPIHHHFELGGFSGKGDPWSETRVVAVFSIITAVMCLIAYTAL